MNQRYLVCAKWRRKGNGQYSDGSPQLDFGWSYYYVICFGVVDYLLKHKSGIEEAEEKHVILSCTPITEGEYRQLDPENSCLVEDFTRDD